MEHIKLFSKLLPTINCGVSLKRNSLEFILGIFVFSFIVLLFFSRGAYSLDGFDLHFRSFFMNRAYETRDEESLAVGGWLKYQTPSYHNMDLKFGLYTSQGLFFTDPAKGGAGILKPDQSGYTVLGEASLNAEVAGGTLHLFRQPLHTPFINVKDSRMIPYLFEAYTFEKEVNDSTNFLVSYTAKIKKWTDTEFTSMTEAAGYNTAEGVALFGIDYVPNQENKFQLWEYYGFDFVNMIYLQYDHKYKVKEDLTLTGSLQYIDQRSVGGSIGGHFQTNMIGLLGKANWPGLGLKLGYTNTSLDRDIFHLWGGFPGFTSIMDEDSNLAGEEALVFGFNYDFSQIGVQGLTMFSDVAIAHLQNSGSMVNPLQRGWDATFDYKFGKQIENSSLRFRLASVKDALNMGGQNYTDCRIILNHQF